MSATIYYQAVKGRALSVGAPSSFLDLLDRVFHNGRSAFTVTDRDADRLRIAAMATDQIEFREALEEMADAAEKHGEIRIWPEY
jgi:hypothetical protein